MHGCITTVHARRPVNAHEPFLRGSSLLHNFSQPFFTLLAPQTRSCAFTAFSAKKRAPSVNIKLCDDNFVSQLAFHASKVRRDAAKILDNLGWKPDNVVEKAHYLIAQSKWDELLRLGEPATRPLIQALNYEYFFRWSPACS